jgi:hypothetical protein
MTMEKYPAWLLSMQNGSIGEARTKAFLLDRFWILERSVDIHGADFLIQRRLYNKNILDSKPPRFGVVQAKFSQNEYTKHFIKKEYVLDYDGNPREEFFVIIHTGNEIDQKMFLLSSRDVLNDFYLNESGEEFIIPSKKVFSPKYEIKDRKYRLTEIESSIENSEFYKNRSFVYKNLFNTKADLNAIQPEYKIDIDNRFGHIPDYFKNQKEIVYSFMGTIEELYDYLKKIVETIDPLEAYVLAEDMHHEFGEKIKLPELLDENFFYAVKNHKNMVDNMKIDGALENYLLAKRYIKKEIEQYLKKYLIKSTINESDIHKITINYDPNTLKVNKIVNNIEIDEKHKLSDFSVFTKEKNGAIIYIYKIGKDSFGKLYDICLLEIMEKIFELKYYENCNT